MAHSALFDHIKLRKLCKMLELPRPHAIGHWECFTRYVADHHVTGDLGSMDELDVEMAAEWVGEPGAYCTALLECRFLDREDGSLVVHDWLDWAPDYAKKRAARRPSLSQSGGQRRRTAPNGAARRTTADNGSQWLPEERKGKERKGKTTPPTPSRGSCATFADSAIQAIYKAYPRKVAKAAALKAIEKALTAISKRPDIQDPTAWLLDRVQAFAVSPAGQAGKYTPHPATWFNAGRYDDDGAEWSKQSDNTTNPARLASKPGKYAGVAKKVSSAIVVLPRRQEGCQPATLPGCGPIDGGSG